MLSFYIQDLYYTCYFDCLWSLSFHIYELYYICYILDLFNVVFLRPLGPFVLYYYAFLNLFDIFILNFNIWEWICVFLCYHSDIMRVLTNVFLFLFPPVCTWVCSQCECQLAGLFVLLWFFCILFWFLCLWLMHFCMCGWLNKTTLSYPDFSAVVLYVISALGPYHICHCWHMCDIFSISKFDKSFSFHSPI